MNLLIIGVGQYGFVAKETSQATGLFDRIDFLDDNSPIALGKLADYESFLPEYGSAFVAMGNPELRLLWMDKLERAGFDLPVLIHPKAVVMPSAQLEEGTIVEAMAVVNSNAAVGTGCLICAGAVINHNARVMACCQIDCNAVVGARATVPEKTKVECNQVFR